MTGRRPRRWVDIAIALTIFVVAFVPRAIYPVSRPPQWFKRSVRFIYDVGQGAWQETLYSEHPGVTTMWLSGIALRLAGVVPEYGPEGAFVDPRSETAQDAAIGVLPLAMVIAAGISLMYGLLRRLFSRLAGSAGALLAALDPLFMGNSKVMHVDALLATFMTLSALSLLVFLRRRQTRWVVLSGCMAGLALLTKAPALYLVPYAALCLGIGVLFDREVGWWRGIGAGALWLAVACLTYIALFPSMWVDPLGTLGFVYSGTVRQAGRAHPHELYFLGSVTSVDPGAYYYVVVWACKLTGLVSVMAPLGVLGSVFGREHQRGQRVTIGLLVAFALFFTIQMTLALKKMPRYLLPAFPTVDILAGIGLVWWAERILKPFEGRRRVLPAVVILVLVLQGAFVVGHHPYYGTHFNSLVGSKTGIWALSTQWQGEGLDIAASAIDSDPESRGQVVGSDMKTFFRQYYDGDVFKVDKPADWYVFGINTTMRGEGTEDGIPWDFYRRRQPQQTVSFGGITYVWVYPVADGPQNTLSFSLGSSMRLLGYDIAPPPYEVGDTLRLQLHWRAIDAVDQDYTVFVHLLNTQGELVAQQDVQPAAGQRPTTSWEPGETIIDPYDLDVPADVAPGDFTVAVGMYGWPSLVRVPVYDPAGGRQPDDLVVLRSLSVTKRPLDPWVWVARAAAVAVLVSAVVNGRKKPDKELLALL